MTTHENTQLPRSILVIEDSVYHGIARDPQRIHLLQDVEAMVIPFASQPELNTQAVLTARAILRDADQLSRDTLLVRNPYRERAFEYADAAIESFASEKYLALANVARLLGATRVKYGEVNAERTDVGWVAGIKAKATVGKADAEARRSIEQKVERAIEGDHQFSGGSPDVGGARDYIRQRGLISDQQLAALVEMRTGRNLIQRYQMTSNGLKESTTNLRVALELANAGPAQAIRAGTSFARTAALVSRIEITIDIEFGEGLH